MKKISLSLLLVAGLAGFSFAQDLKLPALSPSAKLIQSFSTSEIEISYSRPSMKGRKIFGDVVAYNKVWRTGANGATKVKFGEEVIIAGEKIPAGEYAIYTIPSQSKWEVILNKGTGNWGTSGYDTKDDVVRFTVNPSRLSNDVQTFTVQIADLTLNSCNIELLWEKTKIVIPVKANNADQINASIQKAVENPVVPYYQAAQYYYETNQQLEKALEYAEKATASNPNAFWVHNLKAKIAQKLNKKDVAVEAATRAAELAKGSAYEAEYQRNAERIIKSFR